MCLYVFKYFQVLLNVLVILNTLQQVDKGEKAALTIAEAKTLLRNHADRISTACLYPQETEHHCVCCTGFAVRIFFNVQ